MLHQMRGLGWAIAQGSAVVIGLAIGLMDGAVAQIVPDGTLGAEGSRVTPNVQVRGRAADRIDGGAVRGANLFHSFQEFNVGNGQRVYFANPTDVRNILTRVTGNNLSNILGTLGVDGGANLFLMNPNGIVFGQNARLDVAGSFVGTTANRFTFWGGSEFSATNPQAASLLTVNVPIGLQLGANPRGTIANTGNLITGQDLTLSGNTLDLQGRLQAGRNLTLQAQDRLRVRDSVTNPFVAAAGGQMLVQGDRAVDIFALNHPSSGFFSGGDMVLRSGDRVGGDAHYWSGGNFRVEQLDGSLGGLFSPHDPIIHVTGDLYLSNYTGASLHILAGGFVFIPGTILITGADGANTSLAENVTLSNGTVLPINGSARPTLDIRAGVDPAAIGNPLGVIGDVSIDEGQAFDSASGSAILIGDIGAPSGQVFLTNQYQPNNALDSGSIVISGQGVFRGINVSSRIGEGGSVVIDSRNNIALVDGARAFADSSTGRGGDIQFIAGGNITLDRLSVVETYAGPVIDITSDTNPINNNRGGDISLSAKGSIVLEGSDSLLTASSLLTNGGGSIQIQGNQLLVGRFSSISSFTLGTQGEGNITIQATDSVQVNGGNIGTATYPAASASGGDIVIKTGTLTVIGAAEPDASIPDGFSTGGDITSDTGGRGSAGNINIDARQLRIINGGQIRASTLKPGNVDGSGTGNAGNITITASDGVEVTGSIGDYLSKIATSVNGGATGQGGRISIETSRLSIRDEAQIQAGAFGAGQGGSVIVNAPQSIEIVSTTDGDNATGILTGPEGRGASGNGGTLNITTGQLTLRGDGAQIANEVDLESTGNSGSTFINVDRLTLTEGGRIRTGTLNTGQGGGLQITASDSVELSGVSGTGEDEESSGILVGTFGLADAGDLTLTTPRLTIRGGAAITASTLGFGQNSFAGTGRGGNITINGGTIEVSGKSAGGIFSNIVSEAGSFFGIPNPTSRAPGGNIRLTTEQLTVQDGAFISTQTVGVGNAGNLTISATGNIQLLEGNLRARTLGAGNAGNITITAEQLTMQNGEATAATNNGGGRGGNISVTVRGTTELMGGKGGLAASSSNSGDAGNLTLQTNRLIVRDGAGVITESIGRGRAGDLTIIAPGNIEVNGGRFVTGAAINATVLNDVPEATPLNPTQVYFLPSRISASVGSPSLNTPAANLAIETGQLAVRNGGLISTQTRGVSSGGRLSINSPQIDIVGNSGNLRSDIESSPSILSAQTSRTGDAGDISISTRQLNIQDNAEVAINSQGTGRAGSLDVTATNVTLDRGTITAETASSQGGDIGLNISDSLRLRNNSKISASTETGQGGNVSLNRHTHAANTVDLTGSSSIAAQATGTTGNAGSLNLRADRLNLQESQVTVSSQGTGTAGNLTVTVPEINLNRSRLTANTASGSGGNVELRSVDRLNLRNNSEISATTQDGKGGRLSVNANQRPADTLQVNSGSNITTEATGRGDAGRLNLNTQELTVQGSSPAANSNSSRNRADDRPTPSSISATSRSGTGGDIRINADRLTVQDRGRIAASTRTGQAGDLTVNADSSVRLSDRANLSVAATGDGGRAGNLSVNTRQLIVNGNSTIAASNTSSRPAGNAAPGGNITLSGLDTLQLNHSQISASTETGQAGNLSINAGSVELNDSRLLVQATAATGQAGGLTVTSDRFTADNGSSTSVSSRAGRAGTLEINANAISLDNSRLTAEAGSDSGAEINLRELDQLYLKNRSQISARAFNQANGGNVAIEAANGFVIAQIGPNQNNDIIANASEGRGGNIEITTQGIFGIQEREQSPATNDINASSEFGLSGNIDINQLNADPSRGLIELPTIPLDATNQIAAACPTNAQEADRFGSFIVSGRGGLPPNPIDLLSEDNILTEWVTPGEHGNIKAEVPLSVSSEAIVEAQGWVVNTQGKVILVAPPAPPAVTPASCPR